MLHSKQEKVHGHEASCVTDIHGFHIKLVAWVCDTYEENRATGE